MKRLVTLLLASLVSFGLLVACNPSPGAQPSTPVEPMEPEPMEPEPMEPVVMDVKLNLLGWTDRGTDATAGTFMWTVKARSGVAKAEENIYLGFTDAGSDLAVGPEEVDGTVTPCAGLGDLNPMVSGRTITFSGTLTAACTGFLSGFDAADGGSITSTSADTDDLEDGDKVAFEITLSELPATMAVERPDDQKITLSGTVTLTREVTDDDDIMVEVPLSGTVTYKPPATEVKTQEAGTQ